MIHKTTDLYHLLCQRDILDILIGDGVFGEITSSQGTKPIEIAMPYLSGSHLCDISKRFGLNTPNKSLSRWKYMEDIICHCISINNICDLLCFIFSKQQFISKLKGCSTSDIDRFYGQITEAVIKQINSILYFGNNKLVLIDTQVIMKPIDAKIIAKTPAIKILDRDYIKGISDRAMHEVTQGNFDSAITKSRTLLEEIFCYIIESKDETPSSKGDIGQLYKQAKQLYNMHYDEKTNTRFNTLLSGLEKIVTSIAQMRNAASDAHGVGINRVNIFEYHARLLVNAAMIMADFMLSVKENNFNNQKNIVNSLSNTSS